MLTTIASFSFPYEAQIARAKLESEGIPAFLADEHTINAQWLYSNALGGVRLQVPDEFVDRANEVLGYDSESDLIESQGADEPICTNCGGSNTEFYQVGKRWAFLVFLGADFPLFPVRHTRKCLDCGHIQGT